MWPDCNTRSDFDAEHNSDLKWPPVLFRMAGSGKGRTRMRIEKTVPVAFGKLGVATDTAPLTITAPRLFGLDTGDWSMILFGLALSALLLALV